MYILSINDTKKIECRLVAKGPMDNMLRIYTNQLTPIEAYTFFDDPEEIEEITISKINDTTGETEEVHKMLGYTEVFAVQKPSVFTEDKKMILIVLRRIVEEEAL